MDNGSGVSGDGEQSSSRTWTQDATETSHHQGPYVIKNAWELGFCLFKRQLFNVSSELQGVDFFSFPKH